MIGRDDDERLDRLIEVARAKEARRPPSYTWTDPQGVRWKVTPDGVWRWEPSVSAYVLSGWRSAVSDQLLRLAGQAP